MQTAKAENRNDLKLQRTNGSEKN